MSFGLWFFSLLKKIEELKDKLMIGWIWMVRLKFRVKGKCCWWFRFVNGKDQCWGGYGCGVWSLLGPEETVKMWSGGTGLLEGNRILCVMEFQIAKMHPLHRITSAGRQPLFQQQRAWRSLGIVWSSHVPFFLHASAFFLLSPCAFYKLDTKLKCWCPFKTPSMYPSPFNNGIRVSFKVGCHSHHTTSILLPRNN